MAIIRRGDRGVARPEWDPFERMESIFRGWDPFRQMAPVWNEERGFVPVFEVKETKDGYVFKADLPGVKEADLDISLAGNMLTVSGRREEEKREEGEAFFTYERSYGAFTRSFTLPESADVEHPTAELKEGVLTLHLPKRAEMKPRKIQLGRVPIGGEKARA